MLISHSHQFIFIKSTKTAGTSTEVYFEQFCVPPVDLPGDWNQWHTKSDSQVTDFGVSSARGQKPDKAGFFHHMTPVELVDIVGKEIWDSYFTFINVRNPWDKVVSRFFHSPHWEALKDKDPQDSEVKDAFNAFAALFRKPLIDKSALDDTLPFDDFIRYEDLENEIGRVMTRLNLDCTREIPRLKTDHRAAQWGDYRTLYGEEAKKNVANQYADWIERFAYTF